MISVCIAEDQALVRQGIRHLLELSTQVTVASEAADGDEALAVITDQPPDVLLLDLSMPGRDGLATLAAMREQGLDIPTLVLTTFDDDELVFKALRLGARGYLLKDVTLEQLVGAIRTLASGGTLIRPALTERLERALEELPEPVAFDQLPPPQPLTERESEVLRLLASGFTNRQLAEALYVTEGTAKNHVSHLLMKLGVPDRTRAVLRALHLGLLTDHDTRPPKE